MTSVLDVYIDVKNSLSMYQLPLSLLIVALENFIIYNGTFTTCLTESISSRDYLAISRNPLSSDFNMAELPLEISREALNPICHIIIPIGMLIGMLGYLSNEPLNRIRHPQVTATNIPHGQHLRTPSIKVLWQEF